MDAEELVAIVEQQRALQAVRRKAAEAAGGAVDPIVGRWIPCKLLPTAAANRECNNAAPSATPPRQALLFDLQTSGQPISSGG